MRQDKLGPDKGPPSSASRPFQVLGGCYDGIECLLHEFRPDADSSADASLRAPALVALVDPSPVVLQQVATGEGESQVSEWPHRAVDRILAQDLRRDEVVEVNGAQGGFLVAGWCGSGACEGEVQATTGATLCVLPFEGELRELEPSTACARCGAGASETAVFARAY